MRIKDILFVFVFVFCLQSLYAQDSISSVRKETVVHLEYSDVLYFDEELNPDAQILKGAVCFRHDSSYMYCDSALFYEKSNSLEAFGNVRMEQGDTLFVYAQYLYYDGNVQLAQLRNNVRMENKTVTLFTDSLDYDRIANKGYYFNGGLIVDEENELSSLFGQYSPGTKLSVFKDSVKLVNPSFVLLSDTLLYNTQEKFATILGPSVIESDSARIETSRGVYNTTSQDATLLNRSKIYSGSKVLIGDSIVYEKAIGIGRVFGNMYLNDTINHVILRGNIGFYNEQTEYSFTTDSAMFEESSQGDTLYLHADTLQMVSKEAKQRILKAFHGVRFYRKDIQGVCDSLQFNTVDSVLNMYTNPVLWNEEYQLFGDTISILFNDSTVELAHVKQFAFAIQNVDSISYNQLKGNDLKAYFLGKQVKKIEVEGNAESIFYPVEKNGELLGLNKSQSGYLSIELNEGKLDRLKIWSNPQGTMTPIQEVSPSMRKLNDFFWFDYLRPQDKNDIFRIVKHKVVNEQKHSSNKFVHK